MTFTRCAHEQCFHGQARAERRFDQAHAFDAHDAVAAFLPAQASTESLQPTVVSATNDRILFPRFFFLRFRIAAKRHIHEPNANFSPDQSDGAARWLEIRERQSGDWRSRATLRTIVPSRTPDTSRLERRKRLC